MGKYDSATRKQPFKNTEAALRKASSLASLDISLAAATAPTVPTAPFAPVAPASVHSSIPRNNAYFFDATISLLLLPDVT